MKDLLEKRYSVKKKTHSDDKDHMIKKGERFFDWADKTKIEILISSIVISEILTPEPLEICNQLIKELSENFIIGLKR